MRRATILALLLASPGAAQTVVDPRFLRPGPTIFDPQPGDTQLPCAITPGRPVLNYGFRFQAGYRVSLPAAQFRGKGHFLMALLRITPQDGRGAPVYLVSRQRLPEIPKTNVTLQFGGGYLLGEGKYTVNWVLRDDQGRVCRKNWHVDVHRGRGEAKVEVAMPRDTVWDFSLRGSRPLPSSADDAHALRLTILLNAAPLGQRRMRLQTRDIATLLSAVSSLLERVPARQVRFVVFNLEQQRELYRNADFMLRNMPDVADAMNAIELNTVDVHVLENRRGHVDLLTNLVNEQINAQPPSDIVLFLGPASRYFDRVPSSAVYKSSTEGPRFVCFQILPLIATATATLPDVIRNVVSRVGGRTEIIHTPGDFAKAIARLEKR